MQLLFVLITVYFVTARVTEKQLMWANGGPGVYACDYRKYYDLQDDDWKFDTIPEFMDGT